MKETLKLLVILIMLNFTNSHEFYENYFERSCFNNKNCSFQFECKEEICQHVAIFANNFAFD